MECGACNMLAPSFLLRCRGLKVPAVPKKEYELRNQRSHFCMKLAVPMVEPSA